jgi:WD40 repeat protein
MTRITFWNLREQTSAVLPAHAAVIRSLAVSADGARLVSASADGTAKVWQVTAPLAARLLHALPHPSAVYFAELNPDGSRVVTAAVDGSIRQWDVRQGGLLGQSPPHSAPANVARFSPDGSRIISGGDDQRLRLWDAETLHPAAEPMRLDAAIDDARFLDDGRLIRVRLEDDRAPTFALTRAGSLNGAGSPPDLELFTGPPPDPALRADSRRWLGETPTAIQPSPHGPLAAVARGKTAQIWYMRTRRPHAPPLAHDDLVNAVQFSPDGTRLVTSTTANRVRVWQVADGLPLTEPLLAEGVLTSAAFTRDGRHAVAQLASGSRQAWPLFTADAAPLPWLPDLAEAIAGFRLDRDGHPQPVTRTWSDLRAALQQAPSTDALAAWATRLLPVP